MMLKFFGPIFERIDYVQLELLKFRGFRFGASEDTNCHTFSIFLNVSLLLVFCPAQKIILANKHNAK